jgi:hypothetical protein
MPTRILREGILTSEAVNRLSDKAELFYRRLMSVVDDYGRFYAHPSILRAHCYPLKVDSVSEADVKQMLSECISASPHPLILIYGEGKYLQVANFRQQTRSKSKFPEPPAQPVVKELLSECKADDSIGSAASAADASKMISLVGVGVGDEGEDGVVGVGGGGAPKQPANKSKGSIEEVKAFCKSIGLPEADGEWFFYKSEGNGWKNNGVPIKDWKATIRAWRMANHLPSQKNPQPKPPPAAISDAQQRIEWNQELTRATRELESLGRASDYPEGSANNVRIKALRARASALRSQLGILV